MTLFPIVIGLGTVSAAYLAYCAIIWCVRIARIIRRFQAGEPGRPLGRRDEFVPVAPVGADRMRLMFGTPGSEAK